MLLLDKKVELNASQDVIKWLKKKGFDRAYGARPLARCVDEYLKKPLVDELLFGRLVDGGRVTVDLDKEKDILKFHFSTMSTPGNLLVSQKQPVTT